MKPCSGSLARRVAGLERQAAKRAPTTGDAEPAKLAAMLNGWLASGYVVRDGGEYAPADAGNLHARSVAALLSAFQGWPA